MLHCVHVRNILVMSKIWNLKKKKKFFILLITFYTHLAGFLRSLRQGMYSLQFMVRTFVDCTVLLILVTLDIKFPSAADIELWSW